jgi:hypothetical protein
MVATAFGGVQLEKKLSRILEEKTDLPCLKIVQNFDVELGWEMRCGKEEKFLEPMPTSAPRHGSRSVRKPVNQGFLDGALVGLESRRKGAWPRSEDGSASVTTISSDIEQNSSKYFGDIAMAPNFSFLQLQVGRFQLKFRPCSIIACTSTSKK